MKSNQKLYIQIKGKVQNFLYPLMTYFKAATLGLKTHTLYTNQTGVVELVVEGDKAQLWKLVNWSKNGFIFLLVEEILFKFVEAEVLI